MENLSKKRENIASSTESEELNADNRIYPMNVDGKNIVSTPICETKGFGGAVNTNFGRLGVDVGKDTEFPSSKTSVASSDADLDDAKSTGSSHPFSSPNPSEYDDHLISNEVHASSDKLDLKRPYKRRKQLELLYTGRLAYPFSERKQMALLMQMTAPEQQNEQPKSPGSAPSTSGAKVRGKLPKIHRRNDRGETSMHMFAKRGDNQQVLELIREGAEVNVVDYAGWTPLHEACNKGWYETAEILIQHGANVNACGLENDTPLHDAALNGNKNLVILLLRHGGDAFKSNARGKSPLDVAEDKEIIELLKNGPPTLDSSLKETKKTQDFRLADNSSKISPQTSPNEISCSKTNLISPSQVAAVVRVTDFPPVVALKGVTAAEGPSNKLPVETYKSSSNFSSLSTQSSRTSNEFLDDYSRRDRHDDSTPRKIDETCVDASDESGDDQKAPIFSDSVQPALAVNTNSVDSETEARLVVVEDEETDKEDKMLNVGDVPIVHENVSTSPQRSSTDVDSTHNNLISTPKIERPKRRIVPPMRKTYGNVVSTTKKVENRGRKRKVVEKDVYEFHSSDSDVEMSMNESPLNANRRKLIKLTDKFNEVSLNVSCGNVNNTSIDDLNSTKTSSDSTIGYGIKLDNDNNDAASTSFDPGSMETDDVNAANDVKAENDDDVDSSFKSDQTTPTNGRGRSSSHGSANFSPILSTTTLLASRKERLLGFRRRRGSHTTMRYGNLGNASRQNRIDDIVRNVSAGTENNGQSSFVEPKNVDDSASNLDELPTSSSCGLDNDRHKSDSDLPGCFQDDVRNGRFYDAPKVPPLKLVLSNPVRTQQIAIDEDANRTYIVRSRTSSIDKREDVVDETSPPNVINASLNVSSSSIIGPNGETTQRVTRSQVRLHGPNNEFIRQIEEAQVFPAKKRKLKQKTIEPVAASRHWKPVLSMNLAGMASKNSFEAHHELRKTIEQKWQEARIENDSIRYTPPKGYNQFLLSKKSYLLRKNAENESTNGWSVPDEMPSTMSDLFKSQEKEREGMRIKHRIERERLILACETEAIRVHNRITRGTADPPLSAMRVLRDADVYNPLQLDKPIPFSYAALSLDRYVETCSMDDVLVRFGRSKKQLVGRQRLESDCLMATQFNEWTNKCKTVGEIVVSSQKLYDRSSFPLVCIVSEFDLLPPVFVSS